ncbi:hypothetical protein CCR98_20090 [Stenotrophomonas sp. WZN-1]|uniref:hypothetical protein n=1 Tax=Stenotrophomonas TaxID=40323 RepID=UPI000B441030|nr:MULTISPECIES: hypothetical protein [Stenotrophomonas]ARZ76365.1 hypothetical protein CCR98_20090 [Stenotrophomonas sp. WZN-1]
MATNKKEVPACVARSAKLRSGAVLVKIETALGRIEEELKSNGGVYPKNGGLLPLAEVCRRAGVHPQTLQNKTQAQTKRYVQDWLKGLISPQANAIVRGGVGAAGRAERLQQELSLVAAKYQLLYQVEIPLRDERLEALRRRVEELEVENRALAIAAAGHKVVAYPKATPK